MGGFLETRRGYDFVRGIGINYNVPGNDDLAVRLLAESGFKCFRIEIGWSSVEWDEQHLSNEARWRHVLALCKEYGIRPVLLLNANDAPRVQSSSLRGIWLSTHPKEAAPFDSRIQPASFPATAGSISSRNTGPPRR